MKKISIPAVVLLLGLFVMTAACQASPGSNAVAMETGTAAPGFTLKSLSGDNVTLSSFKGKNVVLLDFWATWCPPCREAMPHLQKLHEEYGKKGLTIMSINLQEKESTVKKFIKSNGFTFNILLDQTGEVANAYGVRGIPTMVLIDKNGKISMKKVGYSESGESELAQKIRQLLK